MNIKLIHSLSFGRDSFMTFTKNIKNNVDMTLYYYNNTNKLINMPEWYYTKLHSVINFDLLQITSDTYFDIIDTYLIDKNIETSYFSVGEYSSLCNIGLYAKNNSLGFYNPYLFKSYNFVLNDMKKLECKFLITSATLDTPNTKMVNNMIQYIGKILSANELTELYNTDKDLYFSFQSTIISDNIYTKDLFSNEEIQTILSLFEGDKTKFIYKRVLNG